MSDTCGACQEPIDLTQPHVKLVQQTERETAGDIHVTDSAVVGQWHLGHEPAAGGLAFLSMVELLGRRTART